MILDDSGVRPIEDLLESEAQSVSEKSIITTTKRELARGGVVGARRVIHPEASAGGTCGLCVAAATRKYKTSQLQPIHDRCKCTVLPIIKVGRNEIDPGNDVNYSDIDLDKAYKQLEGSTRSKLSNQRFVPGDDGKLCRKAKEPKTQTGGTGDGKKPPLNKQGNSSGESPKRHRVEYGGSLGRKGDPNPPSVKELAPFLAPASDKWAAFGSVDDVRTATWLRENLEIELWSLYRRPGKHQKTPESLLEDLSGSMELKTATSQASIVAQCRAARHQSRRVVVWASGVGNQDVQRAMGSILSQYGEDLDSVTIIFNNGAAYVQWSHD